MAVFQLPGAPADAYVEKWLPLGSELLRALTPAAAPKTPARLAIEWSPEETQRYQKDFQNLCDLPDATLERTVGAPVLLKPEVTADHLRKSGLPKDYLKEIWHCATTRGGEPS